MTAPRPNMAELDAIADLKAPVVTREEFSIVLQIVRNIQAIQEKILEEIRKDRLQKLCNHCGCNV
jgi:hypothetical protein